jgi:hypothetical protein
MVTQFSFPILPERKLPICENRVAGRPALGPVLEATRRALDRSRSSPRVRHGPRFDQNPMTMKRANTPACSAQSLPLIRIAYLDVAPPLPTSNQQKLATPPPASGLLARFASGPVPSDVGKARGYLGMRRTSEGDEVDEGQMKRVTWRCWCAESGRPN